MLRWVIAGLATLSMASGAGAATSLTFTSASIGVLNQARFNGFTDSFGGGTTALPGLSARVHFTLQGISGNQWSFAYAVANTSGVLATGSRVSIFGFDVSPALRPAPNSASATGKFSRIGSGNVPLGRGSRDVCFRAGGGGGLCASGGGGGVTIGEAASTGVFKLIFAAPTTSVILNDLFVRYQSLNAPSQNISGASGVGDVTSSLVPEPGTWAMLIFGFGTIGSAMRRSRSAATV